MDNVQLARHDLEILRADTLRRIETKLELLQIGLVALQRGKPHVMIDHSERVIDGLSKLITDLSKP